MCNRALAVNTHFSDYAVKYLENKVEHPES